MRDYEQRPRSALYSDYRLSSFGCNHRNGALRPARRHPRAMTRHNPLPMLATTALTPKPFGRRLVKPMVRVMEDDEGVLIFDDAIAGKALYGRKRTHLLALQDDSKNRTVNWHQPAQLCLSRPRHHPARGLRTHHQTRRLPSTAKTDRLKRKSTCSLKNEHLRRMLTICSAQSVGLSLRAGRQLRFQPKKTCTSYAMAWASISSSP